MSVIKVEEVSKVYRRKKAEPVYAVDKVSFEVNQGQIFGLLGPNGAGKSTLVKILNTLTTPNSGVASVCGFDVVRQPLAVRQQIAALPEGAQQSGSSEHAGNERGVEQLKPQ